MKTNDTKNVKFVGNAGILKAYLKEYPWLIDILPSRVLSLKTSRINEELLSQRLKFCGISICKESFSLTEEKGHDLSTLTHIMGHRYIYLDARGRYLGEAGIEKHIDKPSIFNCWFPKPYYVLDDSEVVYEGIFRILKNEETKYRRTCISSVYYIVFIDQDDNVTVYKPPKLDDDDVEYWAKDACHCRKIMTLGLSLQQKKNQAMAGQYKKTLEDLKSV